MHRFRDWSKGWTWYERIAVGFVTIMALGAVQHFAPSRMSFTASFLLATAIVAWLSGSFMGCVMGLIAAGMTLREEWVDARGTSQAWVVWLNAVTRLASFWCVAWVVNGWRRAVWELEDRVAVRTSDLRQEVAERRRAEEQLRESVQRFEQLAANITEVFWMTNPEKSEVIYVSPGYERVWGRSCESLYENPTAWLEAVHPEDSGRIAHAAQTRQTTGDYDEEYRIRWPNGALRWVRDRAFPIRDAAGTVHRVAGLVEDITDRKQAEAALREKDERLRAIINNAPLILVGVDARGTVIFREGAGLKRRGAAPGAGVGRPFEEVLADGPTVIESMRRALAGETQEAVVESRGVCFDYRFEPQKNAAGEVTSVIGVATDITERERTRRRLAVVHAVAQVLAESPAAAAGERILRAVGEGLGAAGGVFWKEDEVPGELRCAAAWAADTASAEAFATACREQTFASGAGLPGRVWADGAPAWENFSDAENGASREGILAAIGARQVAAFSVGHETKTLGVFEFFLRQDSPPDAGLLQLFASIGAQFGQFLARKAVEDLTQMQAFVLEHMAEGIVATDANGFIRITNTVHCRQTGYAREELFDQHITIFSPWPQAETMKQFQAVLQDLERVGQWTGELPHRRKDGSVFPVEVTVTRLQMGDRVLLVSLHRDLTARKQAEAALAEKEARYRTLFELCPDGVLLEDAQGTILDVNHAISHSTGYAREELLGRNVRCLVPPEYKGEVRPHLAALEGGQTLEHVVWNIRKDGTPCRMELHESRIVLPDGLLGILVVARDVTESHQAAEALRGSEERYRSLVNNLNVGVYRNTPGPLGRFIQANPALARMHGYDSVEEFMTTTVAGLYQDPAERLRYLAELTDRGSVANYELRLRRKDGAAIHASVTATAHRGADGQVDWIDGLLEDITERKQAEQTLRMQALILENMAEAVVVTDEAGTILLTNRSVEQMCGYTREELAGQSANRLSALPEPEAAAGLRQVLAALQETGRWDGEFSNRRKDGSVFLTEARINRLAIEGRTCLVSVQQDITERRRAETELRSREERLRLGLSAARIVTWELEAASGAIRYSDNLKDFLGGDAIESYCSVEAVLQQIHAEDREGLAQALQRTLAGNGVFDHEYRARMLDGTYRWILGKGRAGIDAHGRPDRILGVSMDITERKQAAELLQVQRDLSLALSGANELPRALEQLLDVATHLPGVDCGGVYVVDERTGEIDLATHRGLSPEFVNLVSHYPADSAQAVLVNASQPNYASAAELPSAVGAVCVREGLRSLAVIPIRRDGQTLAVLNLASHTHAATPERTRLAIENIAAQVTGAIGRIQAEAARRESETRLHTIISGAPIVLFAVDERGIITFEEGRALEALGVAPGANVGRPIEEVYRGDPNLRNRIRRAQAGEEFTAVVTRGPLAFDCWYSPNRNRNGAVNGFVGVATNVTERLSLERQILEISDREQARIGQDIHDGLCQQLVSVAFDANALEHQLTAQARPEAATARKICALVDEAITESRQVSRGLYPVRLEAEGLVSALEELAALTGERFHVECRFAGEPFPAQQAHAVATHLYRIAQEAVTNAIKHSGARTLTIHLHCRGGQIELKVQDDGRGIAGAPGNPQGMGLHIMRYRARSLGGQLEVGAGPEGGTLVSCCAPCPAC